MPRSLQKKYVLCIPHGGLNDSMCQMELCIQYCERMGRDLIVDLSMSGFMVGSFYDYFKINNACINIKAFNHDFYPELNSIRCYPHNFTNRIDLISFSWNSETHLFYDTNSGKPITFNFTKKYYEPLLVHEQCGGGSLAKNFLQRVVLSEDLKSTINEKLRFLPSNYCAVHIRNTDYKTDYQKALSNIASNLQSKNVLVCSDDIKVIEYFKNNLSKSNVISLNAAIISDNKPIHVKSNYKNDSERKLATINAFSDLMAMALSEKLYIFNCSGGNTSGFSRLAQFLNKNKIVTNKLLLH